MMLQCRGAGRSGCCGLGHCVYPMVPPSEHRAVVSLLPTILGPQDHMISSFVSLSSLRPENTRVSNVTGASGACGFVWCPWFHVVPVVSSVGREHWPLVSTALSALSIVPLSLLVSVSIHCSVSHLWVPFFCSFICPFYLLPAKALAGSDAVCWPDGHLWWEKGVTNFVLFFLV